MSNDREHEAGPYASLKHYGVKGMRWHNRKHPNIDPSRQKYITGDAKAEPKGIKTNNHGLVARQKNITGVSAKELKAYKNLPEEEKKKRIRRILAGRTAIGKIISRPAKPRRETK